MGDTELGYKMEITPFRYNPQSQHDIDKSVLLIAAGTIVFRNFATSIECERLLGTFPRGTELESRKPTGKEAHGSADSS